MLFSSEKSFEIVRFVHLFYTFDSYVTLSRIRTIFYRANDRILLMARTYSNCETQFKQTKSLPNHNHRLNRYQCFWVTELPLGEILGVIDMDRI